MIDDVFVAVDGTFLTFGGGECLTSTVGTLVVAIVVVFTHAEDNCSSGFGGGREDGDSGCGVGDANVRCFYGEGLFSASGDEVRELHSGRGLGVELDAIGDEGESGGGIDIELPREEVRERRVLAEDVGVEVLNDDTGEGFGVKSGPESNATSEDIGVGFVFISGLIKANPRQKDVALSRNVFLRVQVLSIFTFFAIFVRFHESVPHKFIYFRVRQSQTAQKRALAPKSITCSTSKLTPP